MYVNAGQRWSYHGIEQWQCMYCMHGGQAGSAAWGGANQTKPTLSRAAVCRTTAVRPDAGADADYLFLKPIPRAYIHPVPSPDRVPDACAPCSRSWRDGCCCCASTHEDLGHAARPRESHLTASHHITAPAARLLPSLRAITSALFSARSALSRANNLPYLSSARRV